MSMATLNCQFLPSDCHWPLVKARTPQMGHLGVRMAGYMFKSPNLPTLSARPNIFHSSSQVLVTDRSMECKRGIYVASPNISLETTIELLNAYDDEYDGVIVDPECLPSSANAFSASLQSSISYWKLKGKKGVWLRILEEQADLVPIAIKEGFVYHHAEPWYVMLTYWIPEGPCMLPATASHQVGIGAFVINENKEVLVVKEKKCPLRCSGVWKLPTGFIDKSEEIFLGAIREVKEETGIDTEFLEVAAFRHAHLVAFEKSDLFFICMLKPLTFRITVDESEIQDAKWMPLDEFISQPFYQEDSMSKKAIDICIARNEDHYRGFAAHQLMSKFDDRLSYLYYGDLEEIAE